MQYLVLRKNGKKNSDKVTCQSFGRSDLHTCIFIHEEIKIWSLCINTFHSFEMKAFGWESQSQEKLEEINLDFVRAKYWSMLRTIVKTVVVTFSTPSIQTKKAPSRVKRMNQSAFLLPGMNVEHC